jgi:hypothetical protein
MPGMNSCGPGRCLVVVLIVLFFAGGIGTGIYFGVRKDDKATDAGTSANSIGDTPPKEPSVSGTKPSVSGAKETADANDTEPKPTAESAETGKGVASNYADRNKVVARVNRLYGLSYSPFGLGEYVMDSSLFLLDMAKMPHH